MTHPTTSSQKYPIAKEGRYFQPIFQTAQSLGRSWERRFPLEIPPRLSLRKPYQMLWVSEGQKIYLGDVRAYIENRVRPLFWWNLGQMFGKQLVELVLLVSTLASLGEIIRYFELDMVKEIGWGMLGLKLLLFLYIVLSLKLFLPRTLISYTYALRKGRVDDNQERILEIMVTRYQQSKNPKATTLYYRDLRRFSQLIDFKHFRDARVYLLASHLVDLKRGQDLECGSLIGNDFKLELFSYLAEVAQLDNDMIDEEACSYFLNHHNRLKEFLNDNPEEITNYRLLSLGLACLKFYHQLAEAEREKLLVWFQNPRLRELLSPEQQALLQQLNPEWEIVSSSVTAERVLLNVETEQTWSSSKNLEQLIEQEGV